MRNFEVGDNVKLSGIIMEVCKDYCRVSVPYSLYLDAVNLAAVFGIGKSEGRRINNIPAKIVEKGVVLLDEREAPRIRYTAAIDDVAVDYPKMINFYESDYEEFINKGDDIEISGLFKKAVFDVGNQVFVPCVIKRVEVNSDGKVTYYIHTGSCGSYMLKVSEEQLIGIGLTDIDICDGCGS